ncbi:nuclear transport factor 2 family protein [Spongiactinospora sp. TRM90649]|uniref:nuclear transport factor 2 family protein n=1 Tax=Spongiactinospora sp. TRM90649 TaxID=3031114 RepID=UPI0023FA0C49|nr:nuclear transport factor 2 family protein [Spongiactinospora sp. TRM90649]MDF5753060.1 nuclear transport factor 2 family protein [Spongiactinospora sp. TRM90649]
MTDDAVRHVFRSVDSFDADEFARLLAEDARLVFGNAEPLAGRAAIAAGIRAFFSTIGGLRHRVVRNWQVGADTIAETEVTYRRLDGKDVSVVAVSIWRTRDDGLISDYRIFVDLAPVYAV